MHLRQLEAFVAVCDKESFSKAAQSIYLSQPTVSAHIRALEQELGVDLIVRSTKSTYPTGAGKVFYRYAKEILTAKDRALLEMGRYRTEVSGTLTIAASTVPSQYILPDILHRMRKVYPDLGYRTLQMDSREVTVSIAENDAEVGLTGTRIDDAGCEFESFTTDRLVLVVPADMAVMTPLDASTLRKIPFILRESGSGTRQEAMRYLESLGLSVSGLSVVAEMQSTESIKQAVIAGLGASILSKIAVQTEADEGRLVIVDDGSPMLDRAFYIVTAKNRPLSPAAVKLVECLRTSFAG